MLKPLLKRIGLTVLLIFSFVVSNAQLQVDFTLASTINSNADTVCIPDARSFINLSTYNGQAITAANQADFIFSWNLNPKNQNIALFNPTVTYDEVGLFTVSLTVTHKSTGERKTESRTGYIQAFNKPDANFILPDDIGCAPISFMFTDNSSSVNGNIVSYSWSISGSGLKTNQNPTFNFQNDGFYNLTLEVVDAVGCSDDSTALKVIEVLKKPEPNITIDPNFACEPPLISNLTTDLTAPYNHNWIVEGIPGAQMGKSVSVNITQTGFFDVNLVIDGPRNCEIDTTLVDAITVDRPQADFTFPTPGCLNRNVRFTNTTNGTATNFIWDFGDGSGTTTLNTKVNHTYTIAGTYNVTLTALTPDGLCDNQITKQITIEDIKAQITADKTRFCEIPATVNFDASASTIPPGSTIEWTFTNSNNDIIGNANGVTPSYTFNAFDVYSVQMVITSPSGCISSVFIRDYIKVIELNDILSVPVFAGCAELLVSFRDLTNFQGFKLKSRTYDFGDGTTDGPSTTNDSVMHTYQDTGIYTAIKTLEFEEGCILTKQVKIFVGSKPEIQFGFTPMVACAYDTTYFLDSSYVLVNGMRNYDLPDKWMWNFKQDDEDIDMATGQEVFLQHRDSATIGTDTTYNVELIVGYRECYDTLLVENVYNKIGPVVKQLQAKYDCETGKVILEGEGTRFSTVYWKDLTRDSIVTNLLTDTITLAPGVYQFVTVADNPLTGCTYRDSIATVTVPDSKRPVIELVDSMYTCLSLEPTCFSNPNNSSACRFFFNVNLVDINVNTIDSVAILHEDGTRFQETTFGVIVNNKQRYFFYREQPGKYTITVYARQFSGCPIEIKQDIYYLYPQLTISNEVGGLGGCAPLELDLFGAEDFDPNVVANSYNWVLTDPMGDTIINYTADNNPGTINLSNNGTYDVSVSATAIHTIGDTVCPVIINDNKPIKIKIADPQIDFSVNKNRYCIGDSIDISNLTVSDVKLDYTWTLDNGEISTDSIPYFIASKADTLSLTLSVTDGLNCNASLTQVDTIIIDPAPVPSFVATETVVNCPPLESFINPTVTPAFADYSYTWLVDDENISTLDTAFVAKTIGGKYGVKLIVSTPAGCTDSVRVEDVFDVGGPSAEITINKDVICLGDEITVNVINSNNVSEIHYIWGDGADDFTGPDDTVKTHAFTSKIGTTQITVVLDPDEGMNPLGCDVNLTKNIFINKLQAAFDLSTDSLCGAAEVTLTDTSVGTSYTSNFTISPLGISVSDVPTFTNFFNVGIYQITLNISDTISGCQNSITKQLNVFPKPTTQIDPDSILCFGEKITIRASGGSNYEWTDPEPGSLNTLLGSTVIANPSNDATYSVLITDENLCTATESVTIFRDKTNVDFTINPTSACQFLDFNITNNSTASNFLWDFGDGTSSTNEIPNKIYNTAGTFNGSLTAFDLSPRCMQTKNFVITINPSPSYISSGNLELCLGETGKIDIESQNDISWTTNPPIGNVPTQKTFNITPTNDIDYIFTLTDNITGCKSVDTISTIVDNPIADYDITILDSCEITSIIVANPSTAINQNFILGNGDADRFPLTNYDYVGVGQYLLQYVVSDRIPRCADTTSSIINVYPNPIAEVSDDVAMCNYESAVLSASGGITYEWTPDNGILGTNQASDVVVNPAVNTVYKVVVGNQFKCFDSAYVNVNVHPDFSFDTIPDTTIIVGAFIDLDLNPDAEVDIKWSPTEWLNCTDCTSQTIQPLSNICYNITLVDDENCYPKVINPCITIDEQYTVDVPKAFTPNNDQVNDVIFVRGFGIKELQEFIIYNRWGEVVFKTQDIKTGWNGLYKGALQNDETYVYSAKVLFWNGETGSKEGYITLLK